MSTVYLIRHGETLWNYEGLIQGQADVPLSAAGRRQVAALGARFSGLRFGAIYCSDLERALETARALDGPLTPSPLLREKHFGDWQGKRGEEARAADPELVQKLAIEPQLTPYGRGGEARNDLDRRVQQALAQMLVEPPEDPVALVTHHGVILSILSGLLHLDAHRRGVLRMDNTSVSVLYFRQARIERILCLNDVRHLGGDVGWR